MRFSLFVYGTLRSGGSQAWRLADGASFVGMARMAGRLYNFGAYPGMTIPGDACDWVKGEVYQLREPAVLLASLDVYEGSEYMRQRRDAVMDSGETIHCWVYIYGDPVDEARRVLTGDFLAMRPLA